ncbi:hypothetical protein PIB30_106643, partial [Stylosanthes scabra]|nr:hypothetical protein [Stylosanthes scabra]
ACQVWIAASIMSINAGENDWCYPACTQCEKKVEEGQNGKYLCKRCETDEAEADLKYKVEIVACDGTGGISLLLWDTQDNGCSNEVNEDSGVISLEQKNGAGADV